jgi:ribosomal protection tetracycline resistance protein
MAVVNIGILAHVDAGKTSLTERLLFASGAIARLGSVDAGTTQTDSGAIERRRGITIKSAVAAFHVGGLRVNLIDTPGHSDFVAEVERALGVLDGAVLVLSAVEGVQAHSRRLMKTLRRLRVPTLVFVNKIDRLGARDAELVADVRRLLTPDVVPVDAVVDLGTRRARTVPAELDAELLADHDDAVLAALVADRRPSAAELWTSLGGLTAGAVVHPLFFGSALSGEGVPRLLEGIRDLLPRAGGDPEAGEPSGTVFAIERGRAGEKTAYVRLREGTLRNRDKVLGGQITRLEVVGEPGRVAAEPGDIARIGGIAGVKVGDRFGARSGGTGFGGAGSNDMGSNDMGSGATGSIGTGSSRIGSGAADRETTFPPPTLETVAKAPNGDRGRLFAALQALADQDPFIQTRALPGGDTAILLYGDVQKEVIAATLAEEFGVAAEFEPSRVVHVERPRGTGEHVERFPRFEVGPRFYAVVGLRVEPGAYGSGVTFRYETELGALTPVFHRTLEEAVYRTLAQGIHGWRVTDAVVTLTHSGFNSVMTTPPDFRYLTPYVLAQALAQAGTDVYEPCQVFELEVPGDTVARVLSHLIAHEAEILASQSMERDPEAWTIHGTVPARQAQAVEIGLPGLTRGEAVWLAHAEGDRMLRADAGAPPERPRDDGNPFRIRDYLRSLAL